MLKGLIDGTWLRFLLGLIVCGIAICLPYRARIRFIQVISFVAHAPYLVFGRLARFLLRRLSISPEDHHERG